MVLFTGLLFVLMFAIGIILAIGSFAFITDCSDLEEFLVGLGAGIASAFFFWLSSIFYGYLLEYQNIAAIVEVF